MRVIWKFTRLSGVYVQKLGCIYQHPTRIKEKFRLGQLYSGQPNSKLAHTKTLSLRAPFFAHPTPYLQSLTVDGKKKEREKMVFTIINYRIVSILVPFKATIRIESTINAYITWGKNKNLSFSLFF